MKLLCALSVLAAANSFTIAPSPQLSRTVVQLSQEPEQVPEPEEEPEFEPTPVEEETFEPTPVEDFEPTPVEDFEPTPVEEVEPVAIDEPKIADGEALVDLLRLASSTGRGEFATASQKDRAAKLIENLEFSNPTANPTDSPLIQGTWELVYSSTQLFRSSPFFMAGRAVCETEDQAKQYDWFCDMHRGALAISNIGAVRQIISATRMVSEFEVKAGAVPFLSDFTPFAYSGGWPVTIDGAIVSSADIISVDEGNAWEIFMDTVEIKGSNIPGLRQVLDNGLKLQSRGLAKVLEDNISSYSNPKPIFETTYLSEDLRINRDQDGKVFVYSKVDDSTKPSDYSGSMPDLGVTKLIEGFNDSILKFYL